MKEYVVVTCMLLYNLYVQPINIEYNTIQYNTNNTIQYNTIANLESGSCGQNLDSQGLNNPWKNDTTCTCFYTHLICVGGINRQSIIALESGCANHLGEIPIPLGQLANSGYSWERGSDRTSSLTSVHQCLT